jgi:hypothetical protein
VAGLSCSSVTRRCWTTHVPLTNEDLIHKESSLAKCNISQSDSADNLFAVVIASHGCMHSNAVFSKTQLIPTMRSLGFLTQCFNRSHFHTRKGVYIRGIVKLFYVVRLMGNKPVTATKRRRCHEATQKMIIH